MKFTVTVRLDLSTEEVAWFVLCVLENLMMIRFVVRTVPILSECIRMLVGIEEAHHFSEQAGSPDILRDSVFLRQRDDTPLHVSIHFGIEASARLNASMRVSICSSPIASRSTSSVPSIAP